VVTERVAVADGVGIDRHLCWGVARGEPGAVGHVAGNVGGAGGLVGGRRGRPPVDVSSVLGVGSGVVTDGCRVPDGELRGGYGVQ
jgi:hypothetical protein